MIVEDDHLLGSAMQSHVGHQGHAADWMKRLDEAREAMATTEYDLILLDLGLPDGRGLDLLRSIRQKRNLTPVIITTAQDQVQARIDGLNLGADDYMVKPFDLDELSARISAVARRYSINESSKIQIDTVSIDLDQRRVEREERSITLTSREWAVLECLGRNQGTLVSKPVLEEKLYAFGAEIESNAVEVFVSRLRKKLGRELIQTQRGLGYVLVKP